MSTRSKCPSDAAAAECMALPARVSLTLIASLEPPFGGAHECAQVDVRQEGEHEIQSVCGKNDESARRRCTRGARVQQDRMGRCATTSPTSTTRVASVRIEQLGLLAAQTCTHHIRAEKGTRQQHAHDITAPQQIDERERPSLHA